MNYSDDKLLQHVLWLISLIIFFVQLQSPLPSLASCLVSTPKSCEVVQNIYPGETSPCSWCTQIFFTNTEEILISSADDTTYYRNLGEKRFHAAPLDLFRPHAILYNERNQLYYICDTDNDRILVVSALDTGRIIKEIQKIDGMYLHRPHDILIDPASGWIYTINPLSSVILRFQPQYNKEESLDLSEILGGYSRALSLVNGRIYAVGSSSGRVVEIIDFSSAKVRMYQSAKKKTIAQSGNWAANGLILNDVEYFNGKWYATSYFTPSTTTDSTDCNRNKLIRFSSWADFESGSWQDLSALLPADMVPYYLTNHNNELFIALFNHHSPGSGDTVFRISHKCADISPALLPLLLK